MKVIIQPSKLSGEITVPPSKSYTHRAIILACLATGKSIVRNPLFSDDINNTVEGCKNLGAKIVKKNNFLEITGVDGQFPSLLQTIKINCDLSGTTARLITAVAALSPNKVVIDGEKRLRERPMGDLIRALKELGINVRSINHDFLLPLEVDGGEIKGGIIKLPGNVSSQFVSALLLISPFAKKDTTIIVNNLISKPYVDITLDLMKHFGAAVKADGNKYFIKSGQRYKSCGYTVEGDYSSASYFFATEFLMNSRINVKNLNPNSVQGDKYFLEILKLFKKNKKNALKIDLGNYPDIVPTITVCAAKSGGLTKITNIGQLRAKETDRITAVTNELRKMGIKVIEEKDSLTIYGGNLKGAIIDTYNDHRMAMSFGVAGLVTKGETVINNAEVVNKSYPDFWKDLQKVGAKIKIID